MVVCVAAFLSHDYYYGDIGAERKKAWILIAKTSPELTAVLVEILSDHELSWADNRRLEKKREELHNREIQDKIDELKFLGETE